MRIDKFEKLVEAKKMKIEKRIKYLDKEIFICEGYSTGDKDEFSPHYKTMYALSDGPEHITTGEFYTTPILFPIPDKNDRLMTAQKRAEEFLDGMKAEVPS